MFRRSLTVRGQFGRIASLLRLNMNELPMPELKRPELKPLNQPAGKPPMAPVSPVLKKPELTPLMIPPPLAVLKKPDMLPLSDQEFGSALFPKPDAPPRASLKNPELPVAPTATEPWSMALPKPVLRVPAFHPPVLE